MWYEDLSDVTVERFEDGELVVRQEAAEVLQRGAWPLMLAIHRGRSRDGEWQEPVVTLLRFQASRGGFKLDSRMRLGTLEEASRVAERILAHRREGVATVGDCGALAIPQKKG
jgi:hypothetical protein